MAPAKKQPNFMDLVPKRLIAAAPPAHVTSIRSFYSMGPAYEAENGWTVVMADRPLVFVITPEMVDKAAVKSARYCVVAQALGAMLGDRFEWQVLKTTVKIWDRKNKIELRFRTPAILGKAIAVFDKKKRWPLPPNIYQLLPVKIAKRKKKATKLSKATCTIKTKGGKGSKTKVTVVRTPIRRKPRRKSTASRTFLRTTRVSWAKKK